VEFVAVRGIGQSLIEVLHADGTCRCRNLVTGASARLAHPISPSRSQHKNNWYGPKREPAEAADGLGIRNQSVPRPGCCIAGHYLHPRGKSPQRLPITLRVSKTEDYSIHRRQEERQAGTCWIEPDRKFQLPCASATWSRSPPAFSSECRGIHSCSSSRDMWGIAA